MSWVNLNDVYVNQTGGAIAGDLSVGGALTINDAKGGGGTYNVANEITTLRDSVSQISNKVLLWSGTAGKGVKITINSEYSFKEFKSFYCLTSADKTIGLPLVRNSGIQQDQHLHGITGWDDGTTTYTLVGLIKINTETTATVTCISKHQIDGSGGIAGNLLKLWGYY